MVDHDGWAKSGLQFITRSQPFHARYVLRNEGELRGVGEGISNPEWKNRSVVLETTSEGFVAVSQSTIIRSKSKLHFSALTPQKEGPRCHFATVRRSASGL